MSRHVAPLAILFAGTLAAQPAQAQAATTIARWVEFAPGSTPGALSSGRWGDAPASLAPTVLVRAVVTDAGHCPSAMLDHATGLTLKQRFAGRQLTSIPGAAGAANGKAGYPPYFVNPDATMPGNFTNGAPKATIDWGVCEAVVPPGHTLVTLDGVDLKLPVQHPKRLLIMADTGCRLNGDRTANGSNQQNCADPTAFPWAYLAGYEATFKPDLILHVGDWFYRDTNCLTHGAETYPGCNTPDSANYEPWGDTFDSWNADVFFPAKPLLAAAPWIMVRGNHESCGRGARGWYALLDPFPLNARDAYAAGIACKQAAATPAPDTGRAHYGGDFEPSYVVPAGGVNILVHDSSGANDTKVDASAAANYDIDLSNLLRAATAASDKPVIFATHRPTFGLVYKASQHGCSASGTPDSSGDWTEQSLFNGGSSYGASAFRAGVPAAIALFVSGHIHQFQYFNFLDQHGNIDNARFAPQLIVGTGGTLLDADCTTGELPHGLVNPPPFSQSDVPFMVQQGDGVASTTPSSTFSQDGFAFAVLDEIDDRGGRAVGYDAGIYKVSSANAGRCTIMLKPRRITCHL